MNTTNQNHHNLTPMEAALLNSLRDSEAEHAKRLDELEALLRRLLTACEQAHTAHETMATRYQTLASEVRQLRHLAGSLLKESADAAA